MNICNVRGCANECAIHSHNPSGPTHYAMCPKHIRELRAAEQEEQEAM